jgi:pyruvate dehydrogenase E1 component alpha subunit
VKLWAAHLLLEKDADEDELSAIRSEAHAEAKEAAEFAKASPYPTKAAILEDVYWEVDHGTPAGRTGRHFFTP